MNTKPGISGVPYQTIALAMMQDDGSFLNLSESGFKEMVTVKCSEDEMRPTTVGAGAPRA